MPASPTAYLIVVAANGPTASSILGLGTPNASTSTPGVGHVFLLAPGRNVIGRAPTAEVVLPWLHISRQHAVIEYFANGSWEIEDLHSRNGTAVNGKKIQPRALVPLNEGDHIQIPSSGDIELLFTFQVPAPVHRQDQPEQDEDRLQTNTIAGSRS